MKSATQRDANTIKRLAKEILGDFHVDVGSLLVQPDITKLEKIIELSGGLDASTGRRDSSTKSRRSRAAKKGAKRKRVTR